MHRQSVRVFLGLGLLVKILAGTYGQTVQEDSIGEITVAPSVSEEDLPNVPNEGEESLQYSKGSSSMSWGPWSFCSATCGVGFRVRFRNCTGTACGGRVRIQTGRCSEGKCKGGSCGSWSAWSVCNATCGGGIKRRTKGQCPGVSKTKRCNMKACPSPKWSKWQPWGPCSVTCGEGTRTRTRTCSGNGCKGSGTQSEGCKQPLCTIGTDKCSGNVVTLLQSSGTINSPGYVAGGDYPDNALCKWLITAPSSQQQILLTVNFFRTEGNPDHLFICDGDNYYSPTIVKLYGQTTPGYQYRSSGRNMFLQFKSNGATTSRGFSLTYKAVDPVCPPHVVPKNSSSGIIASPGYVKSLDYENALFCRWLITAPKSDQQILLTVTSFKTEGDPDHLFICDGDNYYAPTIVKLYGHATAGYQYRSSGRNMFFQFRSNGFTTSKGFSLNYRAVDPVCPAHVSPLRNSSGIVASPGYVEGLDYENALLCRWLIIAPKSNQQILLTVNSLTTDGDPDHLFICDGDNYYSPTIVKLYGHATPGYQYRSSGRNMFLQFKSNGKTTSKGFSLTYKAVDPVCPAHVSPLRNSSGIVASPGYVEGIDYENALFCRWLIVAPKSSQQILLTVNSLTTEGNPDHLFICDGDNYYAPTIVKLYGHATAGYQYRSSGRNMFLQFKSNGFTTSKGFSVTYEAVDPLCPAHVVPVRNSSGMVASPGYVEGVDYENALFCRWLIIAPKSSQQILLTVTSFRTEGNPDHLFICDGDNYYSPTIVKLYGHANPGNQYRSSGRNMFLQFKSNGATTSRGFSLTYKAVG